MKRSLHLVAALLLVSASVLACGGQTSTPTTSQGALETMVAATFQALTPAIPTPQPETPTEVPGLLPHSLVFMMADGSGITQVYRLERDGATLRQLTFEPTNVDSFSANASDGRLVYASNNQLLLVNADGSGRLLLVNGGAVDQNEPYINRLADPLWSVDGNTIVFGYHGLNFYSLATGTYVNVLANKIRSMNGMNLPEELYFPEAYSPDGSKLLVNLAWYEGGSLGIFIPSTSILVRPSMQGIICCTQSWAQDGNSVYIASPWIGMVSSGMWRFNVDGSVNELIPTQSPNGTYNFAQFAFLAPDGQLYYFFNNLPNIPDGDPALMLVRSAADGVSGRVSVLPQYFQTIHEALWSPDASLVIILEPTLPNQYYGGAATLYYTDGRPSMLLLPSAQDISWGP